MIKIQMRNLRFVPRIHKAISDLFPKYMGGLFCSLNPLKWQLRTTCDGHSCRRSVQAVAIFPERDSSAASRW